MTENIADKRYEDQFKFPLWEMVRQRAEEKDISYNMAYREVLPEYQKLIQYKDTEWTDSQIRRNNRETIELKKRKT